MKSTTDSSPWLRRLDQTGSVLSTLCALHCLAMPLVTVALPFWGWAALDSRGGEQFAATAMVALAAICLWQGCRRHERWWLLALLASGATLVLGTQFLRADNHSAAACCASQRDWKEASFMFAGGITIAVAHGLNLHYRRKCGCRLCPGATPDPAPPDSPTDRNQSNRPNP
jgi:hypothetical protein